MATIIHDEDCKCYFDPARIMPMSDGDRKSCFLSCAVQFLESLKVSPASNGGDGNLTVQACDKLKGGTSTEQFWPLYWCDMNYCGLGINQTQDEIGNDPNVNNIINTCNSLGVRPILDSGPPPVRFVCHSEKNSESICDSEAPNPVSKPEIKPSNQVESDSSSTRSTAHPTASSNAPESHGSGTTTTSGSGLSAGARIALAVCSVLGLLTLVGLVFICLRRRKRRKAKFHSALQTHSRHGDGFPCTGGGYSPTPLISPAGSAVGSTADPPLTPPLRLRDRRLLPPILRPATRSGSPPLTPLTPAYSSNTNHHDSAFFPPSPICAPTATNLVPRHERTQTPQKVPIINAGLPPIPPQLAFSMPTAASIVSRGSLNSSTYCPSSLTGHSSLRHEFSTMSIPPPVTPPGSPPRPPRPHETPLEIPDLLSPAVSPPPSGSSPLGPPPSRSLPPPPPLSSPPPLVPPLPATFQFTYTQQQQRSVSSPSFSAVGGGEGVFGAGGRFPGEAVNFMDLARDDRCRGSWGSWDGKDDGVGVGTARSTSSPIILGSNGMAMGGRTVSSPTMGGRLGDGGGKGGGMPLVREHEGEGEYGSGHGDSRFYIGGAF